MGEASADFESSFRSVREPRAYREGVRERVGSQEAEAVCTNFFFRMCGALK